MDAALRFGIHPFNLCICQIAHDIDIVCREIERDTNIADARGKWAKTSSDQVKYLAQLISNKASLDLDDCPQKVDRMRRNKVVSYRIMWGLAMNVVSVLRTRTGNSKACGQGSQKRNEGERECRPISLLSVLEAENIRLRQAVVE